MDVDNPVSVYIRVKHPAPYRKVTEVIDASTGSIMFTKTEDDIDLAFAAGENYATAELTIIRNVADNGAEFRAAYSSSDYILGGWLGRHKGIRKRGGRKSYVKLYPAKIIDMPDNMAVALLRLSPYVRADGYLSNGNGKRKAKNISEIFSLLRVSKTRGYEIVNKLKKSGVIVQNDAGFYIDKSYMGRG